MPAKSKLFNKNYILLLIISLFTSINMQLLNTSAPLYLVNKLSSSASVSGMLSAGFVISSSICRPISGILVDKYGRKVFIIGGMLLFAVFSTAFGFVNVIWALLLFRVLQGVAFALANTAATTAVADNVPPERLGEGLGYSGLASGFASVFGPMLSLSLLNGGYSLPFIGAGVACVAGAAASLFTTDVAKANKQASPDVKTGHKKKFELKNLFEKTAVFPTVIQAVLTIAMSSYMAYGALTAQSKGFDNAGTFYAFAAVGMMLARLATAKVADKVNEIAMTGLSCFICVGACLMMALTKNPNVFLASGALFGITNGLSMPVLNALALRKVGPDRRGAASATFMLGYDGGIGIGSVIWGLIIDSYGYSAMSITAGVVALAIAIFCVIYVITKRTIRRVEVSQKQDPIAGQSGPAQ